MSQSPQHDHRRVGETLRSSLMLLAFGLGILAFLVAIDRPEWFSLRPISSSAAAMAQASDVSQSEREAGR